jgi:hypothetical protein
MDEPHRAGEFLLAIDKASTNPTAKRRVGTAQP